MVSWKYIRGVFNAVQSRALCFGLGVAALCGGAGARDLPFPNDDAYDARPGGTETSTVIFT